MYRHDWLNEAASLKTKNPALVSRQIWVWTAQPCESLLNSAKHLFPHLASEDDAHAYTLCFLRVNDAGLHQGFGFDYDCSRKSFCDNNHNEFEISYIWIFFLLPFPLSLTGLSISSNSKGGIFNRKSTILYFHEALRTRVIGLYWWYISTETLNRIDFDMTFTYFVKYFYLFTLYLNGRKSEIFQSLEKLETGWVRQ